MGGAAIEAMMQALRSNRIILAHKRKAVKNNPTKANTSKKQLLDKKASAEELQNFRQILLKQKTFEQRIRFFIYLISLFILVLGIYYISI